MDKLGFPGLNTGTGIAGPPVTGGLSGFLFTNNGGSGGVNGALGNNNGGSYAFGDGLDAARCNCPLTESEQQFQVVNNWDAYSRKPYDQVRRGHSLRHESTRTQRPKPQRFIVFRSARHLERGG